VSQRSTELRVLRPPSSPLRLRRTDHTATAFRPVAPTSNATTRTWTCDGCERLTTTGRSSAARMHDLRHAHASWLLAGGSNLNGVMERMADSQIQTTQKYLHALLEADQKNLDALDRIAARRS